MADLEGALKNLDRLTQEVVIEGAGGLSSRLLNPSNVYTFRRSASKSSGTARKIGYSTGSQG